LVTLTEKTEMAKWQISLSNSLC